MYTIFNIHPVIMILVGVMITLQSNVGILYYTDNRNTQTAVIVKFINIRRVMAFLIGCVI